MSFVQQTSVLNQNIKEDVNFKNLKGQLNSNRKEDLEKAAKGFEKMFVKMMLKEMTDSLENQSLFGDNPGSDIYNDMFLDEISKQVTEFETVGIAAQIKQQLSRDLNTKPKTIRNLEKWDRISDKKFPVKPVKKKSPAPILEKRLAKYDHIIQKAASKYGVDSKLIKAVIAQESYGNHKAVSHAGAKGLMQLMDGTANDLGVKNSFDPVENIEGGTRHLKAMMNRFDNIKEALAAYNAGAGNVYKYNGIPPFKETQNYVRKVLTYYSTLE